MLKIPRRGEGKRGSCFEDNITVAPKIFTKALQCWSSDKEPIFICKETAIFKSEFSFYQLGNGYNNLCWQEKFLGYFMYPWH